MRTDSRRPICAASLELAQQRAQGGQDGTLVVMCAEQICCAPKPNPSHQTRSLMINLDQKEKCQSQTSMPPLPAILCTCAVQYIGRARAAGRRCLRIVEVQTDQTCQPRVASRGAGAVPNGFIRSAVAHDEVAETNLGMCSVPHVSVDAMPPGYTAEHDTADPNGTRANLHR